MTIAGQFFFFVLGEASFYTGSVAHPSALSNPGRAASSGVEAWLIYNYTAETGATHAVPP